MIRAVFFDSDGVLVDTERMFYEATRDAFAAAGVELHPDVWARLYLAEGNKSPRIAALLGVPADFINETIRIRDDRFQDKLEEGPAALPDVLEALKRLKPRLRLFLVTGAARRHVDLAHRVSGCLPYFEDVVTQDDFDRPKPHPDAYLTALQRADLEAADCLAIEDSPRGAKSAVAAGLRCLVVPTPLTAVDLCPPEAEIIPTLADAVELILNAQAKDPRP
jgi:HAD superfamily hydrolase (TIGR01509 family)